MTQLLSLLKFFIFLVFFGFVYCMDPEEDFYKQNLAHPFYSGADPDNFGLGDDDILWLLGYKPSELQQTEYSLLHQPKEEIEQQQLATDTVHLMESASQPPQNANASTSIEPSLSSMVQTHKSKERKKRIYQCWKADEHQKLKKILEEQKSENLPKIDWEKVARQFPNKDIDACMHRYYHKLYDHSNKVKRKRRKK